MERSHVVHCLQDTIVAIPQANKPYSADILPYLMKGHYFNGTKLVGVKFSDCFKEIVSNKAQRPEVMIPMVALTTTSVYFWSIINTILMYWQQMHRCMLCYSGSPVDLHPSSISLVTCSARSTCSMRHFSRNWGGMHQASFTGWWLIFSRLSSESSSVLCSISLMLHPS